MQRVASPEHKHVLFPLLARIVALLATVVLAIGVSVNFIHKPAEKACRKRGDDWLRSSVQFYFDNTSKDDNKAFEILAGSTWSRIPQGWKISFLHNGRQYSALVTCSGDIRGLHKQ
jgi:hypothetical protein